MVACEEESEGEEGKEGKRWDEGGTSVGEGGGRRGPVQYKLLQWCFYSRETAFFLFFYFALE